MKAFFRRFAKFLVGALLFAQAALVLAACDLGKAPARAFAAADTPGCHEEPARNANLCLAHCLSGDQALDLPLLKVFALPAAPVLFVDRAPLVAYVVDRLPIPATGPPPRIRFQSLLI